MPQQKKNPESIPLAIIGMGCLFPKAASRDEFWANIKNRVDGITEVPATHWSPADYYDQDPKKPDLTYARRGGFLSPVEFDPAEFGISPNTLEATDSAQLLGLVAAQMALRDAGYGPQREYDRSRVSVILGVTGTLELVVPLGARLGHPIWRKALKEHGIEGPAAESIVETIKDGYVPWQENSFPGLLGNVVAGRIANRFNLGGTNCVVDAACGSSLSAAHLASLELSAGRSKMVVTGGVDCFNDIFMYMCFSKTPALSPTGEAKPFDRKADGTILGEGLGMIVLKRLDEAEKDGDRIYAVLKGVGSSSDGRGKSIYAPSVEGQTGALRKAYEIAGVEPRTVGLVEAHGTGTAVGDGVEVDALKAVYGKAEEGPWCALGSVKSMIGHTKAAAGSAGIIKAALSLYHKVLPPTIKVEEPIPQLQDGPFYLNTEKRPWLPAAHPRRAAVSALGFGGSNFHAVLEEYSPAKTVADWDGDVQIFAFSAQNAEELLRIVSSLAASSWEEVRLKAHESRSAFDASAPVRLCFVAEKGAAPLSRLVASVRSAFSSHSGKAHWTLPEGIFFGSGKAGELAVLFPGQGSQYVGMGRDLACRFPQALDVLAQADAACGGKPLSDIIYPKSFFMDAQKKEQETVLRATQNAQPALGAVSLGAWRVLDGFGVKADVFAGHSYGELTALCASGSLDAGDFFRLSRLRGELMAAGSGDRGGMLAVQAGVEETMKAIAEERLDLVVANKNAPRQTVLSGRSEEISRAAEALAGRGLKCVILPVSAAFHSPLVAGAEKAFRRALEAVEWRPGTVAVYANKTARPYPQKTSEGRDLLAGQLACCVEWTSLIENLAASGATSFLEVGPGAKLTGLVQNTLGTRAQAFALDASSGRRSGAVDLARALAALSSLGYGVNLRLWEGGEETECCLRERKKPKMSVTLCGANYRSSKPAPRPKTPVVAAQAPLTAPAAPVASAAPAAEALRALQESINALQRMQDQAAQLHAKYLEGQEQAQQAVQALIEQQQRLLIVGSTMPEGKLSTGVWPGQTPVDKPARLPVPAPTPVVSVPAAAAAAQPTRPDSIPKGPRDAAATAAAAVEPVLLSVVSEKTGYPTEMINADMDLESDLGIDSIKRVEILSAVSEKLPQAPKVKPEHLGTLRTLRQVAAYLSSAQPPSSASPAPVAPSPAQAVEPVLLSVVSEKTGYPAEMINADMDLESDLGIDSIKRVEILSAVSEKLPQAPKVKPEHLGTLRTLRQVAAYLSSGQSVAPQSRAIPQGPQNAAPVAAAAAASPEALSGPAPLLRSILRAVPFQEQRPAASLAPSMVWVSDDGSDLGPAVIAELSRRGLRAELVAADYAPVPESLAGLILLAAPRRLAPGGLWGEDSEREMREAFFLAQRCAPALRRAAREGGAVLMTVSRLDGSFGLSGLVLEQDPVCGALAGLAKTAAREWPEVRCRALDVAQDCDGAAFVAAETFLEGPAELGFSAQGLKALILEDSPQSEAQGLPLRPGDVVLLTGGARGVTAEAAAALAVFKPTLVLLGRSPLPQAEEAWLAACRTEAEVKKTLLARSDGRDLTPKALGELCRAVFAAREVRAQISRLETAGARVVYAAADVRDQNRLRAVLEEVRRRYGPVRGLIHGAGVLADKLITDKTPEAFEAVFSTKVAGLRSVLSALDLVELRMIALYSSSTARFGRLGQSDYAMANEALNKAAWLLARRLPRCRVVSFGWGPWDGGMVNGALKEMFAAEGVGVIGLEAGGRFLAAELSREGRAAELVVLAEAPSVLEQVFAKPLSLEESPFLRSHVINGRPVLPFAVIMEWFAQAALHGNPGLRFAGLRRMRIFKGVLLETKGAYEVAVLAGKASRRGQDYVVKTELRGGQSRVLHASAEVELASRQPQPARPAQQLSLPPYGRGLEEIYSRILFHGGDMKAIREVEGVSAQGVSVRAAASPAPRSWMRQTLRQDWVTEPLTLDAAFQAMILWSFERYQAGCLPSYAAAYRQYQARFPRDGMRVVVRVVKDSESSALADVDFIDAEGRLVASLEGHESTIDRSLNEAFRRNEPVAV